MVKIKKKVQKNIEEEYKQWIGNEFKERTITSDKIFIKNKEGEILNLEDNPSDDDFTNKLLNLVFDNFGSYETRVYITSRTKSIVEYWQGNTNEKKRITAILSCGADGWGLVVSPYN